MAEAISLSRSGQKYPLIKDEKVYVSGDLVVSSEMDEEALAWAWLQFKRDGTLKTIYYEGQPGLRMFLDTYQSTHALGCYYVKDGKAEMRGMGWITPYPMGAGSHTKAEVGMGFFRKVRPEETLRFGWMMIEWAFSELNLATIIGTTPTRNKAAERYTRRLGFDLYGPLPHFCTWEGELSDCWIDVMTSPCWGFIREGIWEAR